MESENNLGNERRPRRRKTKEHNENEEQEREEQLDIKSVNKTHDTSFEFSEPNNSQRLPQKISPDLEALSISSVSLAQSDMLDPSDSQAPHGRPQEKEKKAREEEKKEDRNLQRQYKQANGTDITDSNTEKHLKKLGRDNSNKDDPEIYIQKGRVICLNDGECKKTSCIYLHSKIICESIKECSNDCEKLHFNDLIATLIKEKKTDIKALLHRPNNEIPSKYELLDFRKKIDSLSNKIIELKRSVRSVKENGWDEEDDSFENRTKEQIQAIKEKIEQIELTIENYMRSISKIFIDFFRSSNQGLGNLIDNLQLESHCALELLPIYCKKIDIMDFLENKSESFMVLSGETGSGKSTQLPIYILQHLTANMDLGLAAVIEPRKVSALALAKRVCSTLYIEPGEEVGFEVGSRDSDKKISASTRLVFLTDNQFIQKLMNDENLSKYSVIVIDEAHERTISSDIILGVLRHRYFEKKLRKDLKVIVASASINVQKFSEYLDNAKDLRIRGRQFPITIKYEPLPTLRHEHITGVNSMILKLLKYKKQALENPHYFSEKYPNVDSKVYLGHMLVFVSSIAEMERLKNLLINEGKENKDKVHRFRIFKFHSKMQQYKYDQIFEKENPKHTTKIIIATKIAETSLTFPDLSMVIDTGIDRDSYYNSLRGFDEVKWTIISKSSAQQRAGRAGRTCPGICYRLYSLEKFKKMPESRMPDLQKSNLEHAILWLKLLKISDIFNFQALDKIPGDNIRNSERNLKNYEALDEHGKLTERGKKMSQIIGVEPFLSSSLFKAIECGVFDEVAIIIAMLKHATSLFIWGDDLSEFKDSQLFLWENLKKKYKLQDVEGDHFFYLVLFKEFLSKYKTGDDLGEFNAQSKVEVAKKWCQQNSLIYGTFKTVYDHYHDLRRAFKQEMAQLNYKRNEQQQNTAALVLECLLLTHIVNVCYYSGSQTFGHILVRENDKLENIFIHQNSLHHNKEADAKWIFFSETFDYGNLVAYSVSSVKEEQFSDSALYPELSQRFESVKDVVSKDNFGLIKIKGWGNSSIKKFEEKMAELHAWKIANKILYKIDSRQGIIYIATSSAKKLTIQDEIKKHLEAINQELKNEKLEIELRRNVRVVIEKGGNICEILKRGETMTVIAPNLPQSTTTNDLNDAFSEQYGKGQVYQIDIIRDAQSYEKSAIIMCNDKKYVDIMVQQGLKFNGEIVKLKRNEFILDDQSGGTIRCKVTWLSGLPLGTGAIFFDTPEDAEDFADQLDSYEILNSKFRAYHQGVKIRLNRLPLAVDEIYLKNYLEDDFPEAKFRHCTVYRRTHAFEQDLNKEKETVLEYITQKAQQCNGTFSQTFSTHHRINHIFNFTNSKDANEFISQCNEMRVKIRLSRTTIEKMVHVKPILNSTEISLFRERYKIFKNEYEKARKAINSKFQNLLKINLPFPRSLEGEQAYVKISIEPVLPLQDIKQFIEVAAKVRNELYKISQGVEVEGLSNHKLYPLIFTQVFGKKELSKIEKECEVFISVSKVNRTILIYGKPENTKDAKIALERELDRSKHFTIDEFPVAGASSSLYKKMDALKREFSRVIIHTKLKKDALCVELIGPPEDVYRVKTKLQNSLEKLNNTDQGCVICGTTGVHNPYIFSCQHTYCFPCARKHLLTLCSRKESSLCCFHPGCRKELVVRDIMQIVPHESLLNFLNDMLAKNGLNLTQSEIRF